MNHLMQWPFSPSASTQPGHGVDSLSSIVDHLTQSNGSHPFTVPSEGQVVWAGLGFKIQCPTKTPRSVFELKIPPVIPHQPCPPQKDQRAGPFRNPPSIDQCVNVRLLTGDSDCRLRPASRALPSRLRSSADPSAWRSARRTGSRRSCRSRMRRGRRCRRCRPGWGTRRHKP
jgi:hypothetical protein